VSAQKNTIAPFHRRGIPYRILMPMLKASPASLVLGTLAAADEVTISSQAEGIVRGVLADLGDPVKAGQTLVEIDREKLQYTLDEQRATHARALTKYGASESGHLPPVEETADVRKAAAELAQAKQSHERAGELHKRTLISQQALEDADTTLRLKAASYDAALQNARNLRAGRRSQTPPAATPCDDKEFDQYAIRRKGRSVDRCVREPR
jgi:multidrug efflux pump subunit AcrA (membrane-fusion protein)